MQFKFKCVYMKLFIVSPSRPYKGPNSHLTITRRTNRKTEGHFKTEGEMGVMQAVVKEFPGVFKPGRGGRGSPPGDFDLLIQNTEQANCYCCETPS